MALATENKPLLPNCSLFICVLGEELNFPSCLERRFLNDERRLPLAFPYLVIHLEGLWWLLLNFNFHFPTNHVSFIFYLSSIFIKFWFTDDTFSCFPEYHVIPFNLPFLLIQEEFESIWVFKDHIFKVK